MNESDLKRKFKASRVPLPVDRERVTDMTMMCQICGQSCRDYYIDGKTTLGVWAKMCVGCHREWGVGMGLGMGSMFNLNTGEKVESEI